MKEELTKALTDEARVRAGGSTVSIRRNKLGSVGISSRRSGPVVAGLGLDAKGYLQALRFAAQEAAQRHTSLRLVHACEPWAKVSLLGLPAPMKQRRLEAGHSLDVAARRVRRFVDVEVKVETSVQSASAVAALLNESREASLLVMQRRDITPLRRWSTGSTTSEVVAEAQCPVAVVRPDRVMTGVQQGVVVGVGLTEADGCLLSVALDEARWRRTSLTVVHAWTQHTWATLGGAALPMPREPATRQTATEPAFTQRLRALAHSHPDVKIDPFLTDEPAALALNHLARDAELLVIGRRPTAASGGLGDVGVLCLSSFGCPVLLVPTLGSWPT